MRDTKERVGANKSSLRNNSVRDKDASKALRSQKIKRTRRRAVLHKYVKYARKTRIKLKKVRGGNQNSTVKITNYQEKAVHKATARHLHGLLVWHMMGTGKTITGLTFILNNLGRKVHILCPKALIFVWQTEIQKIPEIDVSRVSYCGYEDAGVFFELPNLSGEIVVLDEAHHMSTILRSPKSKIGKNIDLLNSAHQIVVLTGTPIYRDLVDLAYLVNICAGREVVPYNASDFRKEFYGTIVAKSALFGYAKPILQIFLILFATKLSIAVPKILSISASLPGYYKQIEQASELAPVPNFTTDAINRTMSYSNTPHNSNSSLWNTTLDTAHNYTNNAIDKAHTYINTTEDAAHNYTNNAIDKAHTYINTTLDTAHNYTNTSEDAANNAINKARTYINTTESNLTTALNPSLAVSPGAVPSMNTTTSALLPVVLPGMHDIKLPSNNIASNETANVPDDHAKRDAIFEKVSDDIENKHNRTQAMKDIKEYNENNATEIAIIIDTKKLKFDIMALKEHTMPELESLVMPAMSDIEHAKVAISVYGLLSLLSFCVTLKIDDFKKLNTEKLVSTIQPYVSYYKNGEGPGSGFPTVTRATKFVSYSMHQLTVWLGVTQNCLPQSTIAKLNLATEADCRFYSNQIDLDQYLSNGILIGNMKEPPPEGGYVGVGVGHSPKFEAILSAATGKRAVFYSSFEKNGIDAFMEFLTAKNQSFEYLNINIEDGEKNSILAKFKAATSPCFLCIHPSYTEGVTIAGAQQMHILEPIRLFSTKEQVVARVARLGSHAHLAAAEQKVEIFQWACDMKTPLEIFKKIVASIRVWAKNHSEVMPTENYTKFAQDETPDSIILRTEATNAGDQDHIKGLLAAGEEKEKLTCCIKYPTREQENECLESGSGQGSARLISCNSNSNSANPAPLSSNARPIFVSNTVPRTSIPVSVSKIAIQRPMPVSVSKPATKNSSLRLIPAPKPAPQNSSSRLITASNYGYGTDNNV